MVTIIVKILLCSTILIGFYYFVLAKERTFKFNRLYLLGSVILAYTLPFINLNLPFEQESKGTLIFGNITQEIQAGTLAVQESIDYGFYFLVIYVLISLLFLVRFIYSVLKIMFLKGNKIHYKDQTIRLINKDLVPFSFLNTVFIPQKYFVEGNIDERIFLHEKCHVDQKHSLDILLIEFLMLLSWFNPALYFYKKAMITNHEFLADDFVLNQNFDLQKYQCLILNEINFSQHFNLTHQFNFNNTKKRFIMMTTKKNQLFWMKKLALLPLVSITLLLFSKKVNAQSTIQSEPTSTFIKEEIISSNTAIKPASVSNDSNQFYTIIEKLIPNQVTKSDTVRTKVKNAATAPNPIAPPPPPSVQKNEKVSSKDGIAPPPPPAVKNIERVAAEFPGGSQQLRSEVSKTFNTAIIDTEKGLLKTTVYFNIDEKGNVNAITSKGDNLKFNQEAERAFTVVNGAKTWKPSTEDGVAVKSVYHIPLTMQFE